MKGYSKIAATFWTRGSGKSLRGNPEAQVVAVYLFTCELASWVGIYHLAMPTLWHETGLGETCGQRALGMVEKAGIAHYDSHSELVWVPAMAKFQIGENLERGDKRIKGIRTDLERFGNHAFVLEFLELYGRAFHLSPSEAPSKPLGRALQAPPKPPSPSPAPTPTPAEALTRAPSGPDSPPPSDPPAEPEPVPVKPTPAGPAPDAAAAAIVRSGPSKDHDAIRAELAKHVVFRTLDADHIANVGVKRMMANVKLEWVLAAINECADKKTATGLTLDGLQSALVGFIGRACAPRQPQSDMPNRFGRPEQSSTGIRHKTFKREEPPPMPSPADVARRAATVAGIGTGAKAPKSAHPSEPPPAADLASGTDGK